MVKTVKEALKITLRKAELSYETLETVLSEVQATVNSHPLPYIDDDSLQLLILIPLHFFTGYPINTGINIDTKLPQVNKNDILKQWNREELARKF